MIIENNILRAEDGKLLTNGNTAGSKVILAINDSADNWWEITEEEYNKIIEDEGGES